MQITGHILRPSEQRQQQHPKHNLKSGLNCIKYSINIMHAMHCNKLNMCAYDDERESTQSHAELTI